MESKSKKVKLKPIYVSLLLLVSLIVISFATGLLRIDTEASNAVESIPENYIKLKGEVKDVLKEGKGFLFLTSNWCGPCEIMSNQFIEAAQKYSNLNFYEADIEEHRNVANDFDALNAPSVIFIQDGQVISSGEVGIDGIEKMIDKYASQ